MSVSSSDAEDEELQWEGWEEDTDGAPVKSLFDDVEFKTVEAALEYDAATHFFDLRQYCALEQLDEYNTIRLINYVRKQAALGEASNRILESLQANPKPYNGDDCLIPVLQNDGLLLFALSGQFTLNSQEGSAQTEEGKAPAPEAQEAPDEAMRRIAEENEALREALQQLKLDAIPPDWRSDLAASKDMTKEEVPSAGASTPAGPSAPAANGGAMRRAGGRGRRERRRPRAVPVLDAVARVNRNYFDSYGSFDIHQTMLQDKVRTEAYQQALEGNPSLIKGKVVLDVGCGTGILSLFAARAGAAHVLGVEANQDMAQMARSIAGTNGYLAPAEPLREAPSGTGGTKAGQPLAAATDARHPAAGPIREGIDGTATQNGTAAVPGDGKGVMSVLCGRVEDAQLQSASVDVIVSEWMGYALLFEAMLDSVLWARDRWLKPGGAILPDKAMMYIAATGQRPTGLGFWADVYGFSMEPVARRCHADLVASATVVPVSPEDLLSGPACIATFDLTTMTSADTSFSSDFRLELQEKEGAGMDRCHALVLWFDVAFTERFCRERPGALSTSPEQPQTHWQQTVLTLKHPIMVKSSAKSGVEDGAAAMTGRISVARSPTPRSIDVSLETVPLRADGSCLCPPAVSIYSMSM